MVELGILGIAALVLIPAIIGFVVGVFVYRNNESAMSPVIDKIDELEDKFQKRIKELEKKLDERRTL